MKCAHFSATKADLESERVVDSEEGNELAHSQGMCFFVETSARGNVNVENAFLELALQLKRHYEAGAHIDAQLDAFRISSQSTTTIASKWSSCCNFAWLFLLAFHPTERTFAFFVSKVWQWTFRWIFKELKHKGKLCFGKYVKTVERSSNLGDLQISDCLI